nr:hypothetical protein [Tanacetum cinerariifolium]
MVVAAQNINNSTLRSILHSEKLNGLNFTNWHRNLRIVLRYEKKLRVVEQLMTPAPDLETNDLEMIDKYYASINVKQEVACIMLSKQARQELFKTVTTFHACKQEDGQSVNSYLLKMKIYLDTLKRLGFAMPNELGVSLILNSLNKDYDQFIQNYNMHSMGKAIAELHDMLKLHEKGIPKKSENLVVLTIREYMIHKDKKKPLGEKGNDSIYHHCKEVDHWRRNCPSYHDEKKRKNTIGTSTS